MTLFARALKCGGFGAIGFADDYLKLSRRSSKGLRGRIKLPLEVVLALGATFWIMSISGEPLASGLALPFTKAVLVNLGWFFVPFAILVIVGASNAVNLTDGLDGLAIDQNIDLDELVGAVLRNLVVHRAIARGHALELVIEVVDQLGEDRKSVV